MANDENKIILEFPATNVEIEFGETITFDNISGFLNSDRVTYNGESLTEEIAHLENDKTDKTYVDEELDKKADKTDTYTKAQVDSALSGKANVGVSYTKSEEDNLLSGKADKADTYTKSEVDNALGNKADKSTTYTKQETDTLLSNKADKSDTYTKAQVDDIVAEAIYDVLPSEVASGSVANFETDLALPLKSLEVDVNAVQEAGTPTPSSPKVISGLNAITLDVNDNTEVINLGGTYYGGHFTQDKAGHRQLVVTHKRELLKNWIWTRNSTEFAFAYFTTTNIADKANNRNFVCEIFTNNNNYRTNLSDNEIGVSNLTSGSRRFCIRCDEATTSEEFNTIIGDYAIIYELATPYVIDLPDGEPIITLNGTNNIYADTGDCAVEYKCSVAEYVANHSGGGGAKSLGGVFLGGSNSGSEEEPAEESEDTEKTKEIDEPKEEIKTIGDMKKLGGE